MTTVEIDPVITERRKPHWMPRATRSYLDALPYEWIRQTAPGRVIVAPMRGDYVGSGPLVRFTVDSDGRATGRPVSGGGIHATTRAAHRYADLSGVDFDDRTDDAEVIQTTSQPWLVANTVDVRWAISTRIAPCRWGHRPPTADRDIHQWWFVDNSTRSWAVARYGRTGGPYQVHQHGPRRLWNEIENAYLWWADQGEPPLNQWQLTLSCDQQTTTLA